MKLSWMPEISGTQLQLNNEMNISGRDTADNIITVSALTYFGDFTNVKSNLTNQPENLVIAGNNSNVTNIPSEFGLSQNYPNPFNPSTKIDFSIAKESNVTIKVYDLTGKEVKTLVNEHKQAGNYSVEMNSNSLSSGVYFYRIQASGNSVNYEKTLKMILVK